MNKPKLFLYLFIAGALGGLTNSSVVWSLGAMGVTPALGFSMAPELTFEWVLRRIFCQRAMGDYIFDPCL